MSTYVINSNEHFCALGLVPVIKGHTNSLSDVKKVWPSLPGKAARYLDECRLEDLQFDKDKETVSFTVPDTFQ